MTAALPGLAQLSGSVYTTDYTGTTVQANLFSLKTDVYLNGGPQNQSAGSGLPDGTYYFQVTDPSGAILLSADDMSCRQVVVSGGVFAGPPAGVAPISCTADGGAYHTNPTVRENLTPPGNPHIVQLCPAASKRANTNNASQSIYDANNWCDSTGNPGGVYKVWVTNVSDYAGPGGSCPTGHNVHGFCDSSVKTKTFKVRPSNATPVAYLTVCKFNDVNGDGVQDNGEQPLSGWPITAIGVDTESGPIGTVNEQTDSTGCVTFSVSDFSTTGTATGGVVSVFEGSMAGWQQTAPAVGVYAVDDGNGGTISVNAVNGVPPGASVSSNFYQSFTLAANDNVMLPSFGNTCTAASCGGLVVTKTASPAFTRTYKWSLTKSVDNSTVYSTAGGSSNAAKYTVTATPDAGTDSAWMATGTITMSNSTVVDVTGVQVTDAVDDGGTCTVSYPAGQTSITIPAAADAAHPTSVGLEYTCTYPASLTAAPAPGTNTASVVSQDNVTLGQGTATVDFSKTAADSITVVDGSLQVSDTLDIGMPTLLGTTAITINQDGTISITNPTYTYAHMFTDPAGTCTSHNNTASFIAANSKSTGSSNNVTVKDCQFAPLTVGKSAVPAITASVVKTGPASPVEVAGTSATLNYTVTAQENGWSVSGSIVVSNPNDWEAVSGTVADALPGARCSFTAGTGNAFTVAASGTAMVPYTCVFASIPVSSTGINSATATWNPARYHTTSSSSLPGTANYDFGKASVVISDRFNSNPVKTLGTITGLTAQLFSFADSEPVTGLPPGRCVAVTNTATAAPGDPLTGTSTVMESVCNTRAGALTMGFWKNPNGQRIITNSCAGVETASPQISLMTYLAGLAIQPIPPVPNEVGFNPFRDDTVTTCSKEAAYVSSIISGATCSSSSNTCNSMLRAQMLATALDVYFSDPALGGNQIGAYTGLGTKQPALGSVVIDLAAIHPCTDGSGGASCTAGFEDTRPEFGIDPTANPGCLGTTVGQMLGYSNYNSVRNGSPVATSSTGSTWYSQIKTYQVPAKDSFDDFNNQIAPIAPSGCSPSTTY